MKTRAMTLRERVVVFFARNPSEELTTHDIVEKFGASDTRSAKQSLRQAVYVGVLRFDWQPGVIGVYSAGPVLRAEVGA
jgi:hypothetical protein